MKNFSSCGSLFLKHASCWFVSQLSDGFTRSSSIFFLVVAIRPGVDPPRAQLVQITAVFNDNRLANRCMEVAHSAASSKGPGKVSNNLGER